VAAALPAIIEATGRPQATADDAVSFTRELVAELGIPGLRAYGVGEADFAVRIAQSIKASSLKTNPLTLTEDELTEILARAR
jgi:alcohol dehydrogenase class IV